MVDPEFLSGLDEFDICIYFELNPVKTIYEYNLCFELESVSIRRLIVLVL